MTSKSSDSNVKDIAVPQQNLLDVVTGGGLKDFAAPDPEMLQQAADPEGKTSAHIAPEDKQTLPQLQLLQAMSPAVADGMGNAGQFYNTASGIAIDGPINVIPVFHWTLRRRWPDRDDPRRIPLCQALDAQHGAGVPGGECVQCPNQRMWKNGVPQGDCDKIYAFILHVVQWDTVLLLDCARTKVKFARELFRLINNAPHNGAPFSNMYKIGSTVEKGDKGTYHVLTLETFDELINQPGRNAKQFSIMSKAFDKQFQELQRLHEMFMKLYNEKKLLPNVQEAPAQQQQSEGSKIAEDTVLPEETENGKLPF